MLVVMVGIRSPLDQKTEGFLFATCLHIYPASGEISFCFHFSKRPLYHVLYIYFLIIYAGTAESVSVSTNIFRYALYPENNK